MALKFYKPTTPARRGMSGLSFEEITKKEPERSLTVPLKKKAGRSKGKITVRHRGGGVKRLYRIIDFKRDKTNMPAEVIAIEYDPNRSAHIALVQYEDGEKRYILAPLGLKVGDRMISSEQAEIKPGNCLPLKNIPVGTFIHNLELEPGRGGKLVRSGGAAAQVVGVEDSRYILVQLPSKEIRRFHPDCRATIGQVGNIDWQNINWGKAGRRRLRGWRPAVRGSAMTPKEHPHGGGEGKCPIGLPYPKTPWGKPAFGVRTRKKKPSDKMIVKRRK